MKKNQFVYCNSVHEMNLYYKKLTKNKLIFQLEQIQLTNQSISLSRVASTLRWVPPRGTMLNDCLYNP